MEIKIQCGCGSKFAFDVEPVRGRMPMSLACPRCGVDQTAQADQQISRQLAPPPLPNGRRGMKILNLPGYNVDPLPPVPVTPVAAALPVAAMHEDAPPLSIPITANTPQAADAPALPPAPAPSGGGLKVTRTKHEAPQAPPALPAAASSASTTESAPPKHTYKAPAITFEEGGSRGIMGWLKLARKYAGALIVGFFVVLKILAKTSFLAKIVAVIFGAAAASGSSNLAELDWNFNYSDATQIYIKSDDHQKVLDACTAYWKNQGKTVKAETSGLKEVTPNHYLLTPPHHGYTALVGSYNWEPGFVDGLAKDLSTQLNTTVMTFADTDQDSKGAHRFAVYEAGQKHFAHHYEYAMVGKEIKDSFHVEGENWVKDKGYFKPGKDGFAEFTPLHINLISHKLGLHWWDFPQQATGFHDLSE